jgi:DNA-binding protein HU-beta
MTQKDLINKLASDLDYTASDARIVLSAVIEGIKEAVKEDGSLTISNFGKFSVSRSKARKGRNPHSGESLIIKAHNRINFKPSKALKEYIN